jgi:acyl-homoserine lactone acylase PvdQ
MTRTFAPAALVAALLLLPAAATARVTQAETVLPPGQSGFVPISGSNPHLTDQLGLYQSFGFKPAAFDLPGTTETPFPGVTITRDAYGVPGIHAGNDADAWKGVGYALAQDRLVQLELFRRATEGRLAAVLGPDRLKSDIVARRDYYTPRELRRMLRRLPATLRARFTAYAAGVNAWLAKVAADPSERPLEFVALNLKPGPWKPVDSAAIGVQLARTIPSGDGRELENWRALRRLGAKRFKALLPLRRKGQVATVPASAGRFPSTPGRTRRDERIGFRRSLRFLKTLKAPSGNAAQAARLIRGGSDAWAIRGSGKRSWLFHGPQLGFQIPEQLAEFEVHRPGLDARGVTPPGLPIVGIGRNDHLAWGLTSGASDDDDLYAEKLAGRERYRFKGRTRKMRCRTETFAVSGKKDVKRRFCRTVHGPVQARSGKATAWARKYAIWGHEMDTLVGLSALDEADTVHDAAKAIAKVSWNENTMVADDHGNIGWFHPGRLPNKRRRWDERLPFPGTGGAEWRGILKVSQRPHVISPKRGWLANWNNAPSVAWTIGDAPDTDRNMGRLHRGAYLMRLVRQAAKAPSFAAVKAVDRVAGTHAQQRPLLDGKLRAADAGASGPAKALLDTVLAWDGDYDTTDAHGTVNPGVASWEALMAAMVERLPRAARDWLGGPGGSHQFDFGGADGVAFLRLGTADLRAAAAAAASALTARFGTADPTKWRDPRKMYDVSATGLATPPKLKFYDRGTWQEVYELGP